MTGDVATGKELWVVAQAQMDNFANLYLNSQYVSNPIISFIILDRR
jgi:hypothetical protein